MLYYHTCGPNRFFSGGGLRVLHSFRGPATRPPIPPASANGEDVGAVKFRDVKPVCATIGLMKEAPRQILIRRSDEPKLEVGDTVPIKEGVVGVVLARFTPSGEGNKVHYIVELRPD